MAKFAPETDIPKLSQLIQTKEALERWLGRVGWPHNIKPEETKTGTDMDVNRKARIEGIKHKLEVIDKAIWDLILTSKT